MTTDNRTNEQIVAEVLDEERYYDPDQISNAERAGDIISALRAAGRLVAAQGAAPQAEIHEPDHGRVYCVRCGGNWPCQPAPVLPSSGVGEDDCWHEANCRCVRAGTVDEEKLAEVIGSLDWGYMVDGPSVSEVARAVAEWLKGEER